MSGETAAEPVTCPKCDRPMRSGVVKTAVWALDRVFIVEDIPAQVCDSCVEQFYDEETTGALRRLTEQGFPLAEARREITVPVFSLSGLLSKKATSPEGQER
jgi:YgiT-type zinc finger domain-containing protein